MKHIPIESVDSAHKPVDPLLKYTRQV